MAGNINAYFMAIRKICTYWLVKKPGRSISIWNPKKRSW
jgi:hypothetical protein